jgi:S-adenosylmethionine decarboxylase
MNPVLTPDPEHAPTPKAYKGIHVLYDVYGCDRMILDDEKVLVELLERAAVESGASVLGRLSHSFEPQGVTAIVLLAESHVSIHSWPEKGYAAVDVFTCGDKMNSRQCAEIIGKALRPASSIQKIIDREIR